MKTASTMLVKHIQEPETNVLLQQVLESCHQAKNSTELDFNDGAKIDDGMQVEYALSTLLNESMEWPELQAEIEAVDELAFQIKCISLASLLPVVRTIQARVQRYVVARKSKRSDGMSTTTPLIVEVNDSCDRTQKCEMNASVVSSLDTEANPSKLPRVAGDFVVVPSTQPSEITVSRGGIARRKDEVGKKTKKYRAAKKTVSDRGDCTIEDASKAVAIDTKSKRGKRRPKDSALSSSLSTKQEGDFGPSEIVGSRTKHRKKKPSSSGSNPEESFCMKVSDQSSLGSPRDVCSVVQLNCQ
eukprot:Nitzschia sp. Nitz4//scaffold131_size63436//18319//19218//NITZ4_006269-RA/size63436-processed-gene-0.99-mRNA-1//1//CDS//3329535250//5166//frame0